MKKILILIIMFTLISSCNKNEERLKIIFTGDVILDRGVNDELKLHGDSLLLKSFCWLDRHDFLVINLEGTFTESNDQQKDKFNFKSSEHRASILHKAGVTHASVANNHIFDYGIKGYENTLETLCRSNIIPLGESFKPKLLHKGKINCAILSASLTTFNDSLPISSIDDLKTCIYDFEKQTNEVPLVLYLHWGLEYQPQPEKWQKELAYELIELGVDAIIGHHPHVTQTIEYIKDKPVFYSIGNFIADAYLPETDFSFAVELEIADTIEKVNIIPLRIKNYFPNSLALRQQIVDLKKHIKYSNICTDYRENKWSITQEDFDFSSQTEMWIYSNDKTISALKKINPISYLFNFQIDGVTSNVINLHGKVTEFQIADINNDNYTDILIGIEKKVRFDSTMNKRINIYTFQDYELRPLWLGTKFINEIESFDVKRINDMNYLTTIEKNEKRRIKRIYEWDEFGFALTNF